MTDLSANLRQVLAQTEMVTKVQEKAKRLSEVQQQQVARELSDKVDIRGTQVEEMPESEGEHKINPEEKGDEPEDQFEEDQDQEEEESVEEENDEDEEQPSGFDSTSFDSTAAIDSADEDDGKGRMIDRKA